MITRAKTGKENSNMMPGSPAVKDMSIAPVIQAAFKWKTVEPVDLSVLVSPADFSTDSSTPRALDGDGAGPSVEGVLLEVIAIVAFVRRR
jgi:hypothetical protein